MQRKIKISISISKENYEKIQKKAEELNISISTCITLLIQGNIKLK